MLKIFMKLMLVTLAGFIIVSCDEVKEDPNDAGAAFVNARAEYDDEYFEMALPKLQEFRARFPYSKYSTEAELLIADSHFQMDQYAEAAAVYNQFVKLHPGHPKVDFALFRVGECYWEEAPEEMDRDQEFTEKSIEVWKELATRFPKSKYLSEAKEYKKIAERRLADAEGFVAEFYCKQQKWGACALRSMGIIENHTSYKDLVKTAAKLGKVAFSNLASGVESGKIKSDANLFTRKMTPAQLKAKSKELDKIYSKM
jgi:outer membrane protein assembly factor BamD